jgi:dihydropteroate synthase
VGNTPVKVGAILDCNGRTLDLSTPKVMAVLNVTPDSFSDGGDLYRNGQLDGDLVFSRARQMAAEGAAIIDVGGESTRPGADLVSVQEEIERVLPVVERISSELDVVISVDTSSPELMAEAASAGAGLINDVRALVRDGAVELVAQSGLAVCLMHMQGQPSTMQRAPAYSSVVEEVGDFLLSRVEACEAAGIDNSQILVDPGFGFGKSLEHNLSLLNALHTFSELAAGVLVGMSRKSMIPAVLGSDVEDRLPASLALAAMAVERGANIVRVHDVSATRDAIEMVAAVRNL